MKLTTLFLHFLLSVVAPSFICVSPLLIVDGTSRIGRLHLMHCALGFFLPVELKLPSNSLVSVIANKSPVSSTISSPLLFQSPIFYVVIVEAMRTNRLFLSPARRIGSNSPTCPLNDSFVSFAIIDTLLLTQCYETLKLLHTIPKIWIGIGGPNGVENWHVVRR
jgi:hypothetical protein